MQTRNQPQFKALSTSGIGSKGVVRLQNEDWVGCWWCSGSCLSREKIQSSRQIVLSQTRKKLGRWGWTLDPVVLSQRLVLDFIQFLRFQNSRFHVSMLLIELAQCARTDSGRSTSVAQILSLCQNKYKEVWVWGELGHHIYKIIKKEIWKTSFPKQTQT